MDTASEQPGLGIGDEYRRYEEPVLSAARKNFPSLGEDDLHDLYQSAWEAVMRLEAKPTRASLGSYLTRAVTNRALNELRNRRRFSNESAEAFADTIASDLPSPAERVEAEQDAALARDLMESLSRRQRDVVALRHEWLCEPAEIQSLLGISARTYRRQMERAMRSLSERLELFRAGKWCDSISDALDSYARGYATGDEERVAKQHIEHCRSCAARVIAVRRSASKAAALLPLPALAAVQAPVGALSFVNQAKEQLIALVSRTPATETTTQIAAGGGIRGGGAVTSAIVACVIAGGGAATYCAEQDIPQPLRDFIAAGQPDDQRSGSVTPMTEPSDALADTKRENPREPTSDDGSAKDRSVQAAQQESPAALGRRTAPREFGFEDDTSSQPTATAEAEAPKSSGSEFSASGTPSTSTSTAKKPAPVSGGTEFGPE